MAWSILHVYSDNNQHHYLNRLYIYSDHDNFYISSEYQHNENMQSEIYFKVPKI